MNRETRQALLDAAGRLELEANKLRLMLRDRRGERREETLAAIAQRTRLICELAAREFPGDTPTEQARKIRSALDRYGAGPWRTDKLRDTPPMDDADLWELTRLPQLSERSIRDLLAKARK